MVSSSPVVGRRIGRRFRDRIFAHFVGGGDFRRANQGGRGRARTDGDHHVIGGVKVQGVYGTLMVAEEATGHHRPDGLMVQDNHRERACFAPDNEPLGHAGGDEHRDEDGQNSRKFSHRDHTFGWTARGRRLGDARRLGAHAIIVVYCKVKEFIYLQFVRRRRVGLTNEPVARRRAFLPNRSVHSLNVSSSIKGWRSRRSRAVYLSFFLPTR